MFLRNLAEVFLPVRDPDERLSKSNRSFHFQNSADSGNDANIDNQASSSEAAKPNDGENFC